MPPVHGAYFVSGTVDSLELSAFYERYEGDGLRKDPNDPARLLNVLIIAYPNGVFTSRQIARKLEEDAAFRVLGANNYPDHRTINRFRQQHLNNSQQIFAEVLPLAQELKMLKLRTLVLVGTKLRVNASKHKAMNCGRMQQEQARLRQEVQASSERAERAEASEDEVCGAPRRGDEMPEELQFRQQRLEQIEAAKRRLEGRQQQADLERAGAKTTTTMPPGRVRKGGGSSTAAGLTRCRTNNKTTSPIRTAGS